MTDAPTMSALKKQLLSRHPWHQKMSAAHQWPLMRAVLGELHEPEVKRDYLIRGKFEKEEHFNTRVALSQFKGAVEGIADRFVGAVFQTEAEVDYGSEGAAVAELKAWADDVDGRGTTLSEFLEAHSEEALGMGGLGFFVDKQRPTPQAVADFAASRGGRTTPQTVEEERALGARAPRIVPFTVEQITDWEFDEHGSLLWVRLTTLNSSRSDPAAPRRWYYRFHEIDRLVVRTYDAAVKDDLAARPGGVPCLPPDDGSGIDEPTGGAEVPHGAGRVPFVFWGSLTMRGKPSLRAAARADLGAFNEDSQGGFSRYLHNVPLFVLKTERKVDEINRDWSTGLKLNPAEGEAAEYVATPTEGFDATMRAVEQTQLAAYRQAGADPTGVFEGTTTPESGRAKRLRFGNTEERRLAKFASATADAHFDLLEIVARRLAGPTPVPQDARAFHGSVRYPSRFDLSDVQDLIFEYGAARRWIKSETWHRGMLLRIARLTRGEVDKAEAEKIRTEIEAMQAVELLNAGANDPLTANNDALSGDLNAARNATAQGLV